MGWDNQLRLLLTHPKNQAALYRAVSWQDDYIPQASDRRDRLSHAAALHPDGLAAINHTSMRFRRPPEKAPAFDDPKHLVIQDRLIPRRHYPDTHDVVRANGLPNKSRAFSVPTRLNRSTPQAETC